MTVNWDSATQTVDLVGNANTGTTGATYIGGDKAKEIALKDAGYTASQVTMVRLSNDWEDGRMVYDVEFYVNKTEYDYEIDAIQGDRPGRRRREGGQRHLYQGQAGL